MSVQQEKQQKQKVQENSAPERAYPHDVEVVKTALKKFHQLKDDIKRLEKEQKQLEGKRDQIEQQLDQRDGYRDLIDDMKSMVEDDLEMEESTPIYDRDDLNEITSAVANVSRELEKKRDQYETFRGKIRKIEENAPHVHQRAVEQLDGETEQTPEMEKLHDKSEQLTPDELLQLFNLDYIKEKDHRIKWSDDPVFIFDSYNVIGRVPRYGMKPGSDLKSTRDRMLADLDFLSSQLDGRYFAVFDTFHDPDYEIRHGIRVIFAENWENRKESGDRKVKELVEKFDSDDEDVFVITNDNELAEDVKYKGAEVIRVNELYNY